MRTLEERLDTEIQCDSMVTQRIFALLRDHCYCAMYRTFTGNLSHEEAVLFTLANIRVEGRAVFAVSTRCAVLLGDEAVTALQNYLVQLALVRRACGALPLDSTLPLFVPRATPYRTISAAHARRVWHDVPLHSREF